ncbi:MAG: SEL1-like repeat protein [Alistipes sp.]|nr:SEL1-like repeat protein [Alistipes sp.]
MKRLFAILMTLFVCATTTAQITNSIFIDPDSFRPAQDGLLSGLAIDPIRQDRSRRACVRQKIFFHRMTREEMAQLEPIFPSGTIDCIKCKVADYNSVLILEFTAKPNVRFYLKHPVYGTSNEVEFDYEGGKEYLLEATLNQTYSIVVNSNVAGADVYLNEVYMGKTDASNSLTIKDVIIGGHKLRLEYGNVSAEQDIVVNDGSISFRQNLNTAANEPQFVVFTVEPQSAVVIIDNQHYTLSDGAMSIVLDGGSYNYTVTAAGYHPQSGTFTVAGSKVVKDIRLKADAATVTLTAPDNAEIWVNGAMKGRSSWSGTLNSGTYIFEARKAGHKSATLSKHITSSESVQSYTLPAPTPIFGWLVVLGTPINADVTLDGKAVGQLPLKLDNILVGEHTVVVSKSGYESYTQSVTIAEGKTATINTTLKKQITSTLKGVTPIEIDSSLTAEQLETNGWAFYDSKNYNSAVQYFFKAAQLGRAVSQRSLGYCYAHGLGVTQDYTEAVKWYRKAAEQGEAVALNNLGYCYEFGQGVTKDIAEAVKWYRKAAEQGDKYAQNNLGVCYEVGRGVTKSITEAVKWYKKAAEQGHEKAKANLRRLGY